MSQGAPPFPRKRFGQHFLEPAWVAKVVGAIDPQPADRFVEIGPGRGALTRPLLERARTVLAFEIDRDLAAALRGSHPNLEIVEGDFLESSALLAERPPAPLRVAGNLPYNVSSPVLFKLLELRAAGVDLVDATLMLQREVADRLVASPGGREYGVLSVLVQYAGDVKVLLKLPPGAFRPAPKVQSSLVQVRFREPARRPANPARFEALVRAIFTRRRKTLGNAILAFGQSEGGIEAADALRRADIDRQRRPETLSVDELVRLSDAFEPARGG